MKRRLRLALPVVLLAAVAGCPQPQETRLHRAAREADNARAAAVEAYRALYAYRLAGKVDVATAQEGKALYREAQGVGVSLGLALREARIAGDENLADPERASRIARLTLDLRRKASAIEALLPAIEEASQ